MTDHFFQSLSATGFVATAIRYGPARMGFGLFGFAGLATRRVKDSIGRITIMMTSAVLAVWSGRLSPALPSLGFTVTLLATAAGSVIGPAFAGWALDGVGAAPTFLSTGAIPLAAAAEVRHLLVVETSEGPNG
jgi:hypothetical protein